MLLALLLIILVLLVCAGCTGAAALAAALFLCALRTLLLAALATGLVGLAVRDHLAPTRVAAVADRIRLLLQAQRLEVDELVVARLAAPAAAQARVGARG